MSISRKERFRILARAILAKLGFLLSIYIAASAALFFAMKAMPEDPVMLRFTKFPSPEQIEIERERLGLNRSWIYQYVAFNQRFLSGNWDRSLNTGRGAMEDVAQFFPATLELTFSAMALGILFGGSAALLARASGWPFWQSTALAIGNIGLTVPIFWIGLLLLLIGSLWLGWFPMGGRFDLAALPPNRVSGLLLFDSMIAGDFQSLGIAIRYLALPSVCLSVFPAASIASVLHARLNEPENEALFVALRSRGYSKCRIVAKHLLRVSGATLATVIGTTFGALIGGAFLTETVFSWPGIGRYVVTAIIERDLFVAQHLLLMLIMLVFAIAFTSDVVAKSLHPFDEDEGGKA